MNYQLVLQFQGDSLDDYDALIEIENRLVAELGLSAKVDGHDCGSGEANIFIFTSDPKLTFWATKQVLRLEGLLQTVRAGYRERNAENYILLWPENSHEEFKVK